MSESAPFCLTELRMDRTEWTSLLLLLQELIGGAIRRHVFSPWELQLLLDLQNSRMRKSSRSDTLRRYLRALQHQNAQGADEPMRFSEFLAMEYAHKHPHPRTPETAMAAAPCRT